MLPFVLFMILYLLECVDGTIYTGITNNLKRRYRQHKTGVGGANYTKKHGVRRILYTEYYQTRGEAWRREKEVKTWNHNSKISLAKGTLIKPVIFRYWYNSPDRIRFKR